MKALEDLKQKLEQIFNERRLFSSWGNPELMTQQLKEVMKAFDSSTNFPPERSITKTLLAYRQTGILQSFLDVKYSCFGICQEINGWCLLDDDQLFPSFLKRVDTFKKEPRRFRKCFQGLLSSYFIYPIYSGGLIINWEQLRKYLTINIQIAQQANPPTNWLSLLNDHVNLLGKKPCDRYVLEVRDGNFENLRLFFQEGLGVSRESWIWQSLILSQVEVACNGDDVFFKEDLNRLTRMLQAVTILSGNLILQCVAMLINRYNKCLSKPEHAALRDAAVTIIGNPWLKKTSWDAHVKTQDGHPNEAARLMVKGWIKRRLIKDFFELLIEDGTADQRRLDYWLAFEPVIEDMWFALGPHARQHQGRDFKDFRERAKGMLRELTSPGGAENNAFIMRIGNWYVVEFGKKGNACYIHNQEKLPFILTQSWISGESTSFGLKNQNLGGKKFIHRDSANAGKWEEKLDDLISPLIDFRRPRGTTVIRRPNERRDTSVNRGSISQSLKLAELLDYLKTINVPIKDFRSKEGALWILVDSKNESYCGNLVELGFKYKPGKGWWKE